MMRIESAFRVGALATALVVFGIAGTASAEAELSFGIGGQFGGTYNIDPGGDVDLDGGYYQKLEFDYFFSKYIGIGTFINFATASSGPQGDITMIEAGLAIKPRITLEDVTNGVDFLGTLELMVGYRGMFPDAGYDSDGLGLNLGLDFRARFDNGMELFLEPGFVTQPTGGNDTADVTYGPIGYVLVGVGYSF